MLHNTIVLIGVALCQVFFCAISSAEEAFDSYAVEVVSVNKIAEPRITADSADYRTDIRESVTLGPTFAGKYAVVEIGNGTLGSFGFIVDAKTGQVHPLPVAPLGYEYQLNSRLLIVNPRVQGEESYAHTLFPEEYWLWNGKRFVQIP